MTFGVWRLVCNDEQQRALVFQVVYVKSTGISHKCTTDSTIAMMHGNREVRTEEAYISANNTEPKLKLKLKPKTKQNKINASKKMKNHTITFLQSRTVCALFVIQTFGESATFLFYRYSFIFISPQMIAAQEH